MRILVALVLAISQLSAADLDPAELKEALEQVFIPKQLTITREVPQTERSGTYSLHPGTPLKPSSITDKGEIIGKATVVYLHSEVKTSGSASTLTRMSPTGPGTGFVHTETKTQKTKEMNVRVPIDATDLLYSIPYEACTVKFVRAADSIKDFPLVIKGKNVGKMSVAKGAKLKLLGAAQNGMIPVEYKGSKHHISPRLTDYNRQVSLMTRLARMVKAAQ